MTTIPSIVESAFLAPVTRHTRRVDIFQADAVTEWIRDVPVLSGAVGVDYGRDERRNLDLVLDNIDGELAYSPNGFWYDKILKVFRGVEYSEVVPVDTVAAVNHIFDPTTNDGTVAPWITYNGVTLSSQLDITGRRFVRTVRPANWASVAGSGMSANALTPRPAGQKVTISAEVRQPPSNQHSTGVQIIARDDTNNDSNAIPVFLSGSTVHTLPKDNQWRRIHLTGLVKDARNLQRVYVIGLGAATIWRNEAVNPSAATLTGWNSNDPTRHPVTLNTTTPISGTSSARTTRSGTLDTIASSVYLNGTGVTNAFAVTPGQSLTWSVDVRPSNANRQITSFYVQYRNSANANLSQSPNAAATPITLSTGLVTRAKVTHTVPTGAAFAYLVCQVATVSGNAVSDETVDYDNLLICTADVPYFDGSMVNKAPNPSFESDVSMYTGARADITWDNTKSRRGGASAKLTVNDVSSSNYVLSSVVAAERIPVGGGQLLNCGVSVWNTITSTRKIHVYQYDASSILISAISGPVRTCVGGQWTDLDEVMQLAPNAATVRIGIINHSADTIGTEYWLDCFYAGVPEYTDSTYGFAYRWTGTSHASTSEKTHQGDTLDVRNIMLNDGDLITFFDGDYERARWTGTPYASTSELIQTINTRETKTWETQIGEFMIDGLKEVNFPSIVSVTGRDYVKKLLASKFVTATAFSEGESLDATINSIASTGGIPGNKRFIPPTDKTLGRDFIFERGISRWEAIKGLADAYGYEIYFTGEGILTMREYHDPASSALAYTFLTGEEGNLVTYDKAVTDTRLYNHVVVSGEAADTIPVWAEARNDNPASPTNIALIGDRLYQYVSSFITTTEQAQDVADRFLAIHSLQEYDFNFSSLMLPWLEVGEIVEFIDPRASETQPDRFLLSTLTIPLALGAMSGTGKRVTVLG